MGSTNIQGLYKEWQNAVRAHAALVRDGRLRGLTPEEIDELAGMYLLRIDAAFQHLKTAEAQEAPTRHLFNPASAEAPSTT